MQVETTCITHIQNIFLACLMLQFYFYFIPLTLHDLENKKFKKKIADKVTIPNFHTSKSILIALDILEKNYSD